MNPGSRSALAAVAALTLPIFAACGGGAASGIVKSQAPREGYATVAAGAMRRASGTVQDLTYRADGHMAGFILDDGERVRVAPHAADSVEAMATTGSRVDVRGWPFLDRDGSAAIEASSIANLDTRDVLGISRTDPNLDGEAAVP